MDLGIPNNVRKAMVNQAAAGPHPESHLLNAYAERALSPAEDAQVAGHLATCADCRNVMFLAHSAADQPIEIPESAAPVRMTWFRWALPATAALAIVIALITFKQTDLRRQAPPAAQEAVVTRPAEKTADQFARADSNIAKPNLERGVEERKLARSKNEANGPVAKTGDRKTSKMVVAPPLPRRGLDSVAVVTQPQSAVRNAPPSMAATQPMANLNVPSANNSMHGPAQQRVQTQAAATTVDATSASQTVELNTVDNKVAPPPAASAAPQQTFKSSAVGAMAYSDVSADVTAKRSPLSRMASQLWRISSDGHLERLMQNQWHRALNGVQKSFRVVAYVQDHVWAGGSGPELFHSADGGDNWDTIKVKTADSEFNGTMQTIRASDAQHLAIIADDGSTWTTADGGQTWAKQQ